MAKSFLPALCTRIILSLALVLTVVATPPGAASPSDAAAAAPPPVRGVWVAGPQHNGFWGSREALRAELQQFKAAGLNSVYLVVWMQGRTLYPSERMARLTGQRQLESLGERDVLQEVLDEAGPLGLRVVAWLEFGFASHHEPFELPGPTLLQRFPHWAALGRDGLPVRKNGFAWMNALDPEVQQLLTDLCLELLRRYPKLAGIQGDDRLPALPSSAGHNPALRAAWRAAHAGREPPADDHDPQWLQWRADQLSAFLRRLRATLKAERPDAVLSLAPSPYPWGLQEYLQDWPTWLREGLADELLPQLYRRDLASYQRLLRETQALLPPGASARVFPGLLLALGPQVLPSERLLAQWIEATRAAGFGGEVYFHSRGVAPRAAVLRRAYLPEPSAQAASSSASTSAASRPSWSSSR